MNLNKQLSVILCLADPVNSEMFPAMHRAVIHRACRAAAFIRPLFVTFA